MKEDIRILVNKNKFLVHSLVFFVGLLLIWQGAARYDTNKYSSELLLNLGAALLTSVILVIFYWLYSYKSKSIISAEEIYEQWRLINIYDKKHDINNVSRRYLKRKSVEHYDIIACGGITALKRNEGELLLERLTSPNSVLKVRILTLNPYSPFLFHLALAEKMDLHAQKSISYDDILNMSREASDSIMHLCKWIESIKKSGKVPSESIQIKFYNSLPTLQYHRIGDHLFVSHSSIGNDGIDNHTYEYAKGGQAFFKYTSYFDSLWKHSEFSSPNYKPKLFPQLLIGDQKINSLLQYSCRNLAEALGNRKAWNLIRGIVTIVGYPTQDRRINTNAAKGADFPVIKNICDENGYLAKDPNQVAGNAIAEGKIKFEKIHDKDGKHDHIYAVLAIPLLYSDAIAGAVVWDFERGLEDFLKSDKDDDNLLERNKDIISEAKKSAIMLSIYLGLKIQEW